MLAALRRRGRLATSSRSKSSLLSRARMHIIGHDHLPSVGLASAKIWAGYPIRRLS